MDFNSQKPRIMHLDINSCFATIEQQANPNLRGKPMAVVAYDSPYSCILASSIEAKRLGIKTGMKLSDGRLIYPKLIHLTPDPPKYRDVHQKIKRVLDNYSEKVIPRSIDEYVFKLALGNPRLKALEIKNNIKEEVGEYISVSIGISTNRFLAKVASNIQKPDGLVEISRANFKKVYSKLGLEDLTGIARANAGRLKLVGINNVSEFYQAPVWKLKIAFGGIAGLYWHTRLRGYEIDDFESKRGTFGNSFAPPAKIATKKKEIISKLCQKTSFRLRSAGYAAFGVHLSILFRDGRYWHKAIKTKQVIFESGDIYAEVERLLDLCPAKTALPRIIAVSVFNLVDKNNLQLDFFKDQLRKERLAECVDRINKRWGDFCIYPARMNGMSQIITDRIAFGK